jgi:NAD(P)-dependent dehydrogenase (short-subunit alcohol dehydrogenase family)
VGQLLSSLGTLYTAGYSVDWSRLYPNSGKCVNLPAYPWQKESFWFDTNIKTCLPRQRTFDGPVLDNHIQVASRPGLHIWRVDVDRLPLPIDVYRVSEVPRLPLSVCFQLVLEAASQLMGTGAVALEQVRVAGNISRRETPEIQLSMEVCNSHVAFDLQSRSDPSGAWLVVLQGFVRKAETLAAAEHPEDSRASGRLCAFYDEATERGLEFAPAIQVLDQVVEGVQGSTAVARLDTGKPGVALEAMCQLVTSTAGKTFHPHSIGCIWVADTHGNDPGFVESRALVADPVTADEWTADVRIRSASGACISEMRDVKLRLVEEQPELATADYIYEEAWVQHPLPALVTPAGRHWIIIGNAEGLGRELARHMEAKGEHVTLAAAPGAIRWHESAPLAGVLVLPEPVTLDGVAEPSMAQISMASLGQVLRLAQELSTAPLGESPRLWIVTCGVEPIAESPTPHSTLAHCALRGLGRVILRELPELRSTNVDLSWCPDAREIDALIAAVLRDDSEDLLAFREDQRYVCRLRKAQLNEVNLHWPVRPDASYVITGGLGGLGLLLAQCLSDAGAGQVVLVGRSAPKPRALEVIRAIERKGTHVTVQQCDVADRTQVQQLLDTIVTQGLPLAGIIHAAAVTEDVLIRELTADSLARVFAPKALGAWHLHELTSDIPLDFFVLFSSIAALLPQPGQGSYAAGNAFLDALASVRRNAGQPAVAVRWAAWTATGIWTEGKRKTVTAYRQQGIGRISARSGGDCLLQLLHSDLEHALVAPIDWTHLSQFYAGSAVPSVLRELAGYLPAGALTPQRESTVILHKLRHAGWEARKELLDLHVRQTLGRVLRISAERIDSLCPVGNFGLDSLMGLEFVRRLGADLSLRLPASLVYNYPTIARMVEHLAQRLEPSQEAAVADMSDRRPVAVAAVAGELHNLSEEQVLAELLGETRGPQK